MDNRHQKPNESLDKELKVSTFLRDNDTNIKTKY